MQTTHKAPQSETRSWTLDLLAMRWHRWPPNPQIPKCQCEEKSIQKTQTGLLNAIPPVNQVTERAICPRSRSTTGFGTQINLIWIQSDSPLHSVQWSEERRLEAAADLQSRGGVVTKQMLPLSLQAVRQGHRTRADTHTHTGRNTDWYWLASN